MRDEQLLELLGKTVRHERIVQDGLIIYGRQTRLRNRRRLAHDQVVERGGERIEIRRQSLLGARDVEFLRAIASRLSRMRRKSSFSLY